MAESVSLNTVAHYQLRFESLVPERLPIAVPCDAHGSVHMDHLDERTRSNYLFARAMVGFHFAGPRVKVAGGQRAVNGSA